MLGNKNQSTIPVAFSLMASFMSAITLFGVSAENYTRGTQFMVINFSYILGTPIISHIFLPVFFKLGNLSVYEVRYILLKNIPLHFRYLPICTYIYCRCIIVKYLL